MRPIDYDTLLRACPRVSTIRDYIVFAVLPTVCAFLFNSIGTRQEMITRTPAALLLSIFGLMVFRIPEIFEYDTLEFLSRRAGLPQKVRDYIDVGTRVRQGIVVICVANGLFALILWFFFRVTLSPEDKALVSETPWIAYFIISYFSASVLLYVVNIGGKHSFQSLINEIMNEEAITCIRLLHEVHR